MISIGKVITASAATVGITFLGMSFAKMGVFRTVGVSSAIGIGVAYLAAVTLLPAILVLAGPRGWVKPRRELTARFWRRSGIRIVRRPVAHLVPVCSCWPSWPAARSWRNSTTTIARPCGVGAEFDRVRRAGTPFPHQSVHPRIHPHPVAARPAHTAGPRGPGADGVSASPVAERSAGQRHHPTPGEVPPEFRATYQAGLVGDRLADGSAQIGQRTGDLNRLATGADTLADNLGDVRAQVNKIVPSIQSLVDAFSSVRTQYRRRQAGARRRQRRQARRQHQRARQRDGRELLRRQGHVRLDRPGADGAARQRGLRRRSLLQRHPCPVRAARRRAQRRTASTRSTISPISCRVSVTDRPSTRR